MNKSELMLSTFLGSSRNRIKEGRNENTRLGFTLALVQYEPQVLKPLSLTISLVVVDLNSYVVHFVASLFYVLFSIIGEDKESECKKYTSIDGPLHLENANAIE